MEHRRYLDCTLILMFKVSLRAPKSNLKFECNVCSVLKLNCKFQEDVVECTKLDLGGSIVVVQNTNARGRKWMRAGKGPKIELLPIY